MDIHRKYTTSNICQFVGWTNEKAFLFWNIKLLFNCTITRWKMNELK